MSLVPESGDTARQVFDFSNLTRLPLARIVAAVLLAPLVILCIMAGHVVFSLLVAAASIILAWEWSRLCQATENVTALIGLIIGLLTANGVAMIGHADAAVVLLLVSALMLYITSSRSLWSAAGMLYVGVPSVSLIWLRGQPVTGEIMILWLITLVWASDIGAYICGRVIGGAKLAPRISPNKTWSGVIGGFAGALMWGVGFLVSINLFPFWYVLLASLLVAISAQVGDLLESWIKRQFGVKDTGRLIPGHGGLFDRVDSLMLASLAMALFALLVGEKVAT